MRQAGEYVPIEQAYRSGNDQVLAQNVTEANVQATIERLSPGELNGYRAGIANRSLTWRRTTSFRRASFRRRAFGRSWKSPRQGSRARAYRRREFRGGDGGLEQRYGSQSGSVTSPMQAAMAEQDAFGGSPAMDAAVGVAADAVSTEAFGVLSSIGSAQGRRALRP